MILVYWSNKSENTKRFVDKLKIEKIRLPLNFTHSTTVDQAYILLTPSYGSGRIPYAVPKPVITFLNNPLNRQYIRGVIGTGDINYGNGYCIAADIISRKCNIPVLHKLEGQGKSTDVDIVHELFSLKYESFNANYRN